jgi:hypothetical protein
MQNKMCCTLDSLACCIDVFFFVQRLENHKIWTQRIYTILWIKWNINKDKLKVWQFDFLNNKYKYTL